MTNIFLFVNMLICSILGVICGTIVKRNEGCNFGAGILYFVVLFMIVVSVAVNDDYRSRVERFGTYPDTTITIKNGVSDTTIVHIVKSQK